MLKDSTGEAVTLHTNKLQEQDRSKFMDKTSGQEMEVTEQISLLEWLTEKYKDFGATLEIVSDRSAEGSQFVQGFGGIGAMLRYQVNFEQLNEAEEEDEYYDGENCCPHGLAACRLGCADVLNCRLMFLLPRMWTRGRFSGLGSEGALPASLRLPWRGRSL